MGVSPVPSTPGAGILPGIIAFVTLATPGIALLITAFVFRAFAHAITAFRDIARNSWVTAFGRNL